VQRVITARSPNFRPDGKTPISAPQHGLAEFLPKLAAVSLRYSAQAGGCRQDALSEWIVGNGRPEWDFWSFDQRRYTGLCEQILCRRPRAKSHSTRTKYARRLSLGKERPRAGRPPKTTAALRPLKSKSAVLLRGAALGARGPISRGRRFRPNPGPSFRFSSRGTAYRTRPRRGIAGRCASATSLPASCTVWQFCEVDFAWPTVRT